MESSIITRRLPGGVVEIIPDGEIDLENGHDLRGAIDAVFSVEELTLIRVNLGRVWFIDSVGISALVSGYHTAAVRGVRLVVTSPTAFAYRQLYISGLVGLLSAPRPPADDYAATSGRSLRAPLRSEPPEH